MVDPANQSAAPEHIPRFVRNVSVLGVGFILVEGLAVFVTSTAVAAARMTTTRSALAAWVPTGLGRPNVSLQVSEVGSDQQFCLLRVHATALALRSARLTPGWVSPNAGSGGAPGQGVAVGRREGNRCGGSRRRCERGLHDAAGSGSQARWLPSRLVPHRHCP